MCSVPAQYSITNKYVYVAVLVSTQKVIFVFIQCVFGCWSSTNIFQERGPNLQNS